MLQDKEFLQVPRPLPFNSLQQHLLPLFHTLSCFPFLIIFFLHYHLSTFSEDRSQDTVSDMYVWYRCLCACVWFFEGQGWVVDSQELLSEQSPLQAECSKEQHKAPGLRPAGRFWAPYHLHRGGLGRVLMWATTSRLSRNGLPFTGVFCVCCERQREREKADRDKDLDLVIYIMNLFQCFILLTWKIIYLRMLIISKALFEKLLVTTWWLTEWACHL